MQNACTNHEKTHVKNFAKNATIKNRAWISGCLLYMCRCMVGTRPPHGSSRIAMYGSSWLEKLHQTCRCRSWFQCISNVRPCRWYLTYRSPWHRVFWTVRPFWRPAFSCPSVDEALWWYRCCRWCFRACSPVDTMGSGSRLNFLYQKLHEKFTVPMAGVRNVARFAVITVLDGSF